MYEKVVHCKKEEFDVYIGRPSKWGNPYSIGKDGDRELVLVKYRAYLENHPELIKQAREELNGKVLGCWCKPNACHGDILIECITKLKK